MRRARVWSKRAIAWLLLLLVSGVMPRGFPKACITNDTSPASAAHPIRRKTLACSMIGPVRYAATIASSIADAPPANAGTHGANSAHHEFAAPERHRL
jgi:hypothetical protein